MLSEKTITAMKRNRVVSLVWGGGVVTIGGVYCVRVEQIL